MSSRNVRFAPSDGATHPLPQSTARTGQAKPGYAGTAYLSQSPPRPSDVTFARGESEPTMLYPPSHRRTPSDSASSTSDGSVNSHGSSSPEVDFIPLINLDECLEGLPSGVSRPFDCDLSKSQPVSTVPLHMLSRPACDRPVKYMYIDMGVTAAEVYVGDPSLGYVSVGDVIGALSASLRRPLPRGKWESYHLEFVDARKKRLGKAEPSEVLLVDMLGYHHYFHGLQDGPEGKWQVIFGPKKV